MATLTNVDNINKYKEDPQLYKGRNTIKRLEFVRNDELTDYYENDEYIVWHETNRNQITILRKNGMIPESWYDL